MSCKVVYFEALFNFGYQNTLKEHEISGYIFKANMKAYCFNIIQCITIQNITLWKALALYALMHSSTLEDGSTMMATDI